MRGFRPARLILLFLATLNISGCSDSNGPDGSLDAQIRYVNAIKNTVGVVEIGLEGGPSSELEFGGQSEYQTATLGFRLAFASDEDGTLRTGEVFLGAGAHYTLAFVGRADIRLVSRILLSDDPGEPDPDRAFIRFVQGGLQVGAVDVYLLEEGDEVDGTPTAEAMDWLDISLYGEFASGEVTLVLTQVAKPDSVVFDSGPLTIPSASVRTLMIIDGTEAVDAIDLLVLDDDA
jgi:hypothetical protein